MMKAVTIFLIQFVPIVLISQLNLETNVNFSMNQVSNDIIIRKSYNNFSMSINFGYGIFGARSKSYPEFVDGYNGIFNQPPTNNLFLTEFRHSFSGQKYGFSLGRVIKLKNEKNKFLLDFNFNWYNLVDEYMHSYEDLNSGNSTDLIDKRKNKTISLGLNVCFYRKISERFDLKAGASLPFIFPTINNDNLYKPQYYLPMSGFEPYLLIGLSFNPFKN